MRGGPSSTYDSDQLHMARTGSHIRHGEERGYAEEPQSYISEQERPGPSAQHKRSYFARCRNAKTTVSVDPDEVIMMLYGPSRNVQNISCDDENLVEERLFSFIGRIS